MSKEEYQVCSVCNCLDTIRRLEELEPTLPLRYSEQERQAYTLGYELAKSQSLRIIRRIDLPEKNG